MEAAAEQLVQQSQQEQRQQDQLNFADLLDGVEDKTPAPEPMTPAQENLNKAAEATLNGTPVDTAPVAENVGSETQNPAASEIESTSINDDPSQHTADEQRVIEGYKKSVSENLKGFIERVRTLQSNDYRNKIKTIIETDTNRAASKAGELTGIDTDGFESTIKGNAVQHIDNRHGANGAHDQSMANIEDFSRIGYVLDHFTEAEILTEQNDPETAKLSREYRNKDQTPAKVIRFSMPVNGTYYVVEAIPDTKAKQMAVISAYISENSGGNTLNQKLNLPNAAASSQQPTSKTLSDSMLGVPSTDRVAQSEGVVNQNSPDRMTMSEDDFLNSMGGNNGGAESDPFADRSWHEVGKRSEQAFMSQNPEVKKLFQNEAAMLYSELGDTTRGERNFNADAHYQSGFAAGSTGTTP